MLWRMHTRSTRSPRGPRAPEGGLPANWRNAPLRAIVVSFAAFVAFLALFKLAAYFVPELRAWTRMAYIAGFAGWGIGWYFQKKEAELEQHIAASLARGNALPSGHEHSREMRRVVKFKRIPPGRAADRPSQEMVG
jgi:hypothetical protein